MTPKPGLLVQTDWPGAASWIAAIEDAAPDFKVIAWPELGDAERIVACAVWNPPPELFSALPSLEVIQSLGAGVDHLWGLGDALPDRPILRLVDPLMTERLANYVLAGTLLFTRQFHLYLDQQRKRRWERHLHADPGEICVGLLGTGIMGRGCGEALQRNGFHVLGWGRTERSDLPWTCHSGEDGLVRMAERSHVLVGLLPLTPETDGILDRRVFAAMRPGSYLINAGRGRHLVTPDLLAALESGRLGGALLDVFATEPLPPDDPLWRHPKVIVTPHAAAISNPATAAPAMLAGIRAVRRGERPVNLAERGRGY